MSRFRSRRPSAALIVAMIALILAVGGTAYAKFSVPKNSIGTKQLKKNAVTTKKIKNGAVTASKVNTAGLTVPNALHADTANAATNATDATNATNATHAGDADTIGGVTVKGFSYLTAPSAGKATLFSLDGLTVTATCAAGRIDAKTSVNNAYISAEWIEGAGNTPARVTNTDFKTTDTFLANATTGAETGSIEYVQPDGTRVSVSLQTDMAVACTVSGHAFASG